MVTNLIKSNTAGVFIVVIPQDFLLKGKAAEKVGFYNVKYKYHADYDYFYRLIVKNKMKGISTKK